MLVEAVHLQKGVPYCLKPADSRSISRLSLHVPVRVYRFLFPGLLYVKTHGIDPKAPSRQGKPAQTPGCAEGCFRGHGAFTIGAKEEEDS